MRSLGCLRAFRTADANLSLDEAAGADGGITAPAGEAGFGVRMIGAAHFLLRDKEPLLGTPLTAAGNTVRALLSIEGESETFYMVKYTTGVKRRMRTRIADNCGSLGSHCRLEAQR